MSHPPHQTVIEIETLSITHNNGGSIFNCIKYLVFGGRGAGDSLCDNFQIFFNVMVNV